MNRAILGDALAATANLSKGGVDLVFTSPPYYNVKPEYAEYSDYRTYLDFLGRVFEACHSALAEGRFLVVNTSPVLVPRTARNEASRRLPIPFDLHPILDSMGFDFIEDIIWRKPDGAGAGRGRRFSLDRQPLQYKPSPVTEYVMVYRKRTDKLIDWNLREQVSPEALERSRIMGEYEFTNVWDIPPASHPLHPAVFPEELVKRVISYYSLEGDCVLDPFAGVGTVGWVASAMGRRFILVERKREYFEAINRTLNSSFFAQCEIEVCD